MRDCLYKHTILLLLIIPMHKRLNYLWKKENNYIKKKNMEIKKIVSY